MSVCGYCLVYRSYEWGGECFGWDQAAGCLRIPGYSANHPEYKKAKAEYARNRLPAKRKELARLTEQHNYERQRVEREIADLEKEATVQP